MSYQDKLLDDLDLIRNLREFLHRLPKIPPDDSLSPSEKMVEGLAHSRALGKLESATVDAMERMQYLYCISRADGEDKWDLEWLPFGLAVGYWRNVSREYERGWMLLDCFLDSLEDRVAQLNKHGQLPSHFGINRDADHEFTPLDLEILEAIGDKTLDGGEVMTAINRSPGNGPTKKRLAHLVKTNVLQNKPGHGYCKIKPH